MWQKIEDKYHWLLSADQLVVKDGDQAMSYCRQAFVVQRSEQVSYATRDCCEFCDGVANIIHTAAHEAINYSVKRETNVDVLRRALEFTSSVTLTKAIQVRIRKLEKVE